MSDHIRLITPPGASYDGVTAVDLGVIPFTVAAGTERRDYLLPGNLGVLLGDSLPGLGTGPGAPAAMHCIWNRVRIRVHKILADLADRAAGAM